jgi:hypothetical protein
VAQIGNGGRPCQHGNGSSDSIKEGEYLDQLSDCQLHKDSTPGR